MKIPPFINPAWIKPKERLTLEDGSVYRWFRLVHRDMSTDLTIQPLGRREDPSWVAGEALEEIIANVMEDHHRDEARIAKWALEEGLSPGQLFLVCFHPPTVTGGGRTWYNDDGDYDIEYHWAIVRKQPVPQASALKAWERFLSRITTVDKRWERQEAHQRRLITQQTCRWKVLVERPSPPTPSRLELRHVPKNADARWLHSGAKILAVGENAAELVRGLKSKYPEAPIQPLLVLLAQELNLSRLDFLLLDDAEHHPDGGPVDETLG